MSSKPKSLAAQSLGSLGGKARAKKMTKHQRVLAAQKAAKARWARYPQAKRVVA